MVYSGLVIVDHPVGLHARPAAKFVQLAATYPCKIFVRKVSSENNIVANAKSPLSILTLGVKQGDEIEITAEGEQAEEAINSLIRLIQARFFE